jgi:hypothetical protein
VCGAQRRRGFGLRPPARRALTGPAEGLTTGRVRCEDRELRGSFFLSVSGSGDRKAGPGGRKTVNTRWDTDSPPRTDTGKESGPGTDTSADKDTSDDDTSGSDTSGGEPNVDTGVWDPPEF